MGTPNRVPQEYSRRIIGIYLAGPLYSAVIFPQYSWGSLFLRFPVKSFEYQFPNTEPLDLLQEGIPVGKPLEYAEWLMLSRQRLHSETSILGGSGEFSK